MGKITLSLSSLIHLIYFNNICSITLGNIAFFYIQAPNILIQKMVTAIIVWDLRAKKYATNQNVIANIYISTKNIEKTKVTAPI